MKEEFKMKSYEFDEIATNVFGRVYPIIARQAIEKTGINIGTAMDLGCGGGHLGIALSENTNMEICLIDMLQDAIDISNNRIKEKCLENRVKAIKSNVESIPLEDNSIDLAISRGSLWFWEDKVKAFKEIYRVLKEGGAAYLGGGFGNKELREEIDKKMLERDSESWTDKTRKSKSESTRKDMIKILGEAGIENFEIIDDESGYWVLIRK